MGQMAQSSPSQASTRHLQLARRSTSSLERSPRASELPRAPVSSVLSSSNPTTWMRLIGNGWDPIMATFRPTSLVKEILQPTIVAERAPCRLRLMTSTHTLSTGMPIVSSGLSTTSKFALSLPMIPPHTREPDTHKPQ